MSIERYSEGCFRLRGRTIAKGDIDQLREEAIKMPLRRARICVHYDISSSSQEMFVLLLKDSFKGIYKYKYALSMVLLEGVIRYCFYTDGGELVESPLVTKENPFIKIEAGIYHQPIILSDYVLTYEHYTGQWSPDMIQRAPWEAKMFFDNNFEADLLKKNRQDNLVHEE